MAYCLAWSSEHKRALPAPTGLQCTIPNHLRDRILQRSQRTTRFGIMHKIPSPVRVSCLLIICLWQAKWTLSQLFYSSCSLLSAQMPHDTQFLTGICPTMLPSTTFSATCSTCSISCSSVTFMIIQREAQCYIDRLSDPQMILPYCVLTVTVL